MRLATEAAKSAVIRLATANSPAPQRKYALGCEYHSNTNYSGLGRVQRRILDYLATNPAGFGGTTVRDMESGEFFKHGPPRGVTTRDIARHVYGVTEPSAPQLRVIQRAARRLETLKRVDCWHAWSGDRERRYKNSRGKEYITTAPICSLFVAIRWDCEHMTQSSGQP